MITPTDDSSRLNASPRTFSPAPEPSNSTISPVITPERPWTRAMPSPTSSTTPTSVRVTSAWNCSISCWMTDVISSALNFGIRLPFDQALSELFQTVADRGVVDVVAHLDAQPADQGRVDFQLEDGGAADGPRQPLAERVGLGVRQRDGRADGDRVA